MKRPVALLFCLLMITMPMAGCFGGDDSSDASDEKLDDWNVHFAVTAADLPSCDEDTSGRLYYVEADNQFQVCKTSGWSVIDIQGADGAEIKMGTAQMDLLEGDDGVDGQDGANDGAQGPQGPQGPAGSDGDGQDGDDGEDGTSILITTSSSTSCSNGGNTFNIGPDSNSNGFLEASEVVMNVDICNGAEGVQGPQGPAGNDGADGQDGQGRKGHKDRQEMMVKTVQMVQMVLKGRKDHKDHKGLLDNQVLMEHMMVLTAKMEQMETKWTRWVKGHKDAGNDGSTNGRINCNFNRTSWNKLC